MTQMILQHKIPGSRELKMLRQDNLAFYAEINARAFSGQFMSEVPVQVYLRIIDQVKSAFLSVSPDQDFSKPAKTYLDIMLGKLASYDHNKVEPWVGTDVKNGNEFVVLLEPASRVLRILREGLDGQQSLLAVSSLSSLSEKLTSTAARLSGDVTQQINALENRKNEIEAEIATLKANGARPMTQLERNTEIHSILNDISQIKAGFAEVPAAKRRINRENQAIFLESEKPVGQVLDIFWQRQVDWESSAENAVLTTLKDLHVDIGKAQTMQGGLEEVMRYGEDSIPHHIRRDVSTFLNEMLGISNEIALEISHIWKSVNSYISNPNYAQRREDALVLRRAQTAIGRIRDEVRPSPRDARLKALGLSMTLPLRTHPTSHIKLTMEPPEKIEVEKELAPVADAPDSEERLLALALENAKSAHLSTKRIVDRIKGAMENQSEVTLSDVIRKYPLRYGRHELSRYLAVASGTHPSILIEGMTFTMRFEERGQTTAANIVNPIFRRKGEIGEGFGDFATADYMLSPKDLRETRVEYMPTDIGASA